MVISVGFLVFTHRTFCEGKRVKWAFYGVFMAHEENQFVIARKAASAEDVPPTVRGLPRHLKTHLCSSPSWKEKTLIHWKCDLFYTTVHKTQFFAIPLHQQDPTAFFPLRWSKTQTIQVFQTFSQRLPLFWGSVSKLWWCSWWCNHHREAAKW